MNKQELFLYESFPTCHIKKGQPTNFCDKVIKGEKIHSIIYDYDDYWNDNIDCMKNKDYVISIKTIDILCKNKKNNYGHTGKIRVCP